MGYFTAAGEAPIMIGRLREVLDARPRSRTLYECRHCGTAVDDVDAACPACGSGEIARYVV